MKVLIRKLGEVADPHYPSGNPKTYWTGRPTPGQFSVPIQTEIEGTLMFPIEVGGIMALYACKRNGESFTGTFRSSIVTAIILQYDGSKHVHTGNSIYHVKELK